MARYLVSRTKADVESVRKKGDHKDSRRAAWFAIDRGSEVILDIQREGAGRGWTRLEDAAPVVSPEAHEILKMRLEAIHTFKQAPHCSQGFRPSRHTGD